ncbi:MAG: hypothetical protein WC119_03460 [Synergistaceae bacterium]
MKNSSTKGEIQRLDFVESLYKQMHLQTKSAIEERDRIVATAAMYIEDGVSEEEAVELLVIDGISRDSAESYVQLVEANNGLDGNHEYSFQFEDIYGKLWSSYDINRIITASSDEEAWMKAEEAIYSDPSIEPDKIVSIDKVL